MVRYSHEIELIDGVYSSYLGREPACLNGHYPCPFVYPILLQDGSPLTPEELLKMYPSELNRRRFNSGHYQLMELPEEIIKKTSSYANWREGETPEVTPPYEFAVVWNYQAGVLSVYWPYQMLVPNTEGKSLQESLSILKGDIQAVRQKIRTRQKELGV